MNKNCLLAVASLLLLSSTFAQNIGINADGSRPNSNAILDIKSGNKGLLIPRMDSLARNSIPNTQGLLVYDISTDNFWYNTGKGWECLGNDKDKGQGGNAWLLAGNANTTDGVNFLGTTNNVPLNIRINNQPSGRIDSAMGASFWGYRAGGNNTGVNNTGIGYQSLFTNIAGSFNTAIGVQSLYTNTYGSGLTATGYQALYHDDAPKGAQAGEGFGNTADGYQSLFSSTLGYDNTAVGYQSLYFNVSGTTNTANGYQAMYSNTSGGGNTSTGFACMSSNSIGNSNTATGYQALLSNTTGSYNTVNGDDAMGGNISGNENTANGFFSMSDNTTGSENVGDGYSSLYSNTSGSQNTAIGSGADVSTGSLNNATALGSGAIVDASNKVRIGNSAVTVIEGQVPFTTPSDGRYKFNVEENVGGLDFVLRLRPVTYQFDVKRFDAQMQHQPGKEDGAGNYALQAGYDEATRIRRSGFIAQEVEQAANASGYDFSGIIKPKTEQDHYSLSYDAFVVPLVKAVQEQQQIILQQNKRLDEQDKKLLALQTQLDEIKKLLHPAN